MILVTGARGVVGAPLCERLAEQQRPYLAVSRSSAVQGLQWDLQQQMTGEQLAELAEVEQVIHCAPIWFLPQHITMLASAGIKRIVAFSSTSVLSKQASPDAQEQQLVQSLQNAEQQLSRACSRKGIALTILRPSLIYGYGRDQNVSHIAAFIRRWRFMVLVGKASGQRQPVHADDLVDAALQVLTNPKTIGQAYNLAGKDVLSYRQMVEAIFNGLGLQPRIISVPLAVYRLALSVASRLGRFAYTAEMANRMNQDLSYSISAAKVDFGFQPQGFLTKPQRDLRV